MTNIDRVVDHDGGPLLVLGGPGTGKTHALEQRYLRLAQTDGLAPHRVLVLCNNRRYSMNARDRLVRALPQAATIEVPVYTWHALAHHLISRYYRRLGYRESPVLLTAAEQWSAVRELLSQESPERWGEWGPRLSERAFVDEVGDFCLRVEQRLTSEEELSALVTRRPDWAPVVDFSRRYREHLKTQSRLDYASLLASAFRLLSDDDEVRASLQRRFPHVLVDEGQELSRAQLELLGHLDTSNLVVAADPDSGIETFRGSEPDWVFGFDKWFSTHTTIVLDRSWRLGLPLAASARELIEHNDEIGRTPLVAADHETEFTNTTFTSVATEVGAIAREFRRLHLIDGVAWSEMAVLLSQPRHLLAPLEAALDEWEVPHKQMSGDRPLGSEPSVACFLDLVRVALAADDAEGVLPNLLTGPLFGLDYSIRRSLDREAWQSGRSLSEIVEESPLTEEFRTLRDRVVQYRSRADECFWEIYSTSSYYRGLEVAAVGDPAHPANAELDALTAFSHALGRFVERRHGKGSIEDYLSGAARADFGGDPWLTTGATPTDAVDVLSFHAAKGQEWDIVAVAGCLDAWIPKGRRAQGLFDPFTLEAPDAAERQVEAIADDRRTFYVAATRARRRVWFTSSPASGGRAHPSRFLFELTGSAPDQFAQVDLPPLTMTEFKARLRRTLAETSSSSHERVAAVIALAEVGADASRWYGRWNWTEGSVPLIGEEFRTSYSRLGVFQNCGLQYVLQSVLGLDPSSTYSMKFGTWIHALFQAVHENRIADWLALQHEYNKLFDEKIFPNATIARQFRRDGLKMLKVFVEKERSPNVVKTEYSFEFPYEGAVLRGRIDRIDRIGNNLTLVDYKTAKWAPSKNEGAKSLQLAIYHLAARTDPALKELGEPKKASLVYPGSLWPSGDHKVIPQNEAQADEVLKTLPDMISGALAEDFRPSPDADCFFCKMKPLCPLWPEGREVIS